MKKSHDDYTFRFSTNGNVWSSCDFFMILRLYGDSMGLNAVGYQEYFVSSHKRKLTTMEQTPKRIPYGVANFEAIMLQNQYYVDKTMYLPLLEQQPDTVFFTRPRRFGKSLFMSMLRAYYDCKKKDQFENLFGDLWIGKHPTSLQGRFLVLYLDFSYVGGTVEKVEENFNGYCNVQLDGFVKDYEEYFSDGFLDKFLQMHSAGNKLNAISDEARRHKLPLYLIIDEYDNFTNTILNEQGESVYHAITHADGFYRDIFKKFKGNFERIFMMGVCPVTLDDVTSGFNIGWNISIMPDFNDMLGFTTQDVRTMFEYYKEYGQLPADCDTEAIINDMKPWYDGYCFSRQTLGHENRVFNCDMVLYYLRNYISYGCPPEQMIDPNTRTDYNKMQRLLQFDRLESDRKGMIRCIAETGGIYANLEESFPARALTNADIFPSLLFYYGMLTVKGTRGSQLWLGIPNNNVRKQYYGYLLEQFQRESRVGLNQLMAQFTDMAYDGEWRNALTSMADAYGKVSSVRDSIEGERNLQGFFMAYFSINDYYYTAPELELNHGYCDFFLLPDLTHYATKHSYIIELKLLPKNATEGQAMKQWEEAEVQIQGYASAPRVEALRQGTRLHKIIMQFDGHRLKRMDEVDDEAPLTSPS